MRRISWFSALLMGLDALLLLLALWLAFGTWQEWRPEWPEASVLEFSHLLPFNRFMPSAIVLGLGWIFFLKAQIQKNVALIAVPSRGT